MRSAGVYARAILLLGFCGACELAEVTTPEAEDLLVVESVLRPELRVQRVILHRSIVGGEVQPEPLATIRVRDETTGIRYRFHATDPAELCLGESIDLPLPVRVTCYLSQESDDRWVVPGRSYSLSVTLPGGTEATGRTEVPTAFGLRSPDLVSGGGCRLEPDRKLSVTWGRSRGAWAYLAELEISNLQAAFHGSHLDSVPDRVKLTGLSIAETDTTMTVPTDFGLFQRTLYDQELLLALRVGLPAGSGAHLVIAAVDRNYVNGVRGGTFSPSGRVRVSSIHGDGIGVFGSAVIQRITIHVDSVGGRPCLP